MGKFELEVVLRKAWKDRGNFENVSEEVSTEDADDMEQVHTLGNFCYDFKIQDVKEKKGITKDCELVVNKVVHTGQSTLMVAVVRDVSNRSQALRLEFEKEKNLIARETAHTVKNLNTSAHHKLLDLLDEVHGNMETKKTEWPEEYKKLQGFEGQLRQTLAIMMTAAQQTYQLSRVGEILRGEAQHLEKRVDACTQCWEKICGQNFHADADALALLVDEFRIVAILSNGWSNALAHGDCQRMNETKISLVANHEGQSLQIIIVNASQHDEIPFQHVNDDNDLDNLIESQQERDEFGSSPAAKLTTRMGLKWMRKLCAGRLSLHSEGHGGKTTLTCEIDADNSELLREALAEFVVNKQQNKMRRNSERTRVIATPTTATAITPTTAFPTTVQVSTTVVNNGTVSGTEDNNQSNNEQKFAHKLASFSPMSKTTTASPPLFTSSPRKSSDSLTPYASAHLQSSGRTDIRVWDAALSCALLHKYGITVVDGTWMQFLLLLFIIRVLMHGYKRFELTPTPSTPCTTPCIPLLCSSYT